MKIVTPLFILLLSFCSIAQSSKVFHQVFTERDGLIIDQINAMETDRDGFLWIGGHILDTRAIIQSEQKMVLQRLNGKTFHQVLLPEDHGAVSSVLQIYRRADGQFYVLVQSEKMVLWLFDPITMEFKYPEFNKEDHNSLSFVFQHQKKDYVLTQNKEFVVLNELHPDLTLSPLFSFENNVNKFLLDSSTKFIPFADYCLIGDDNFPIVAITWDGDVLKRYSNESFNRDRDVGVQKFWIKDLMKQQSSHFCLMNGKQQLYKIDSTSQTIIPYLNHELPSINNQIFSDRSGRSIVVSVEEELVLRTWDLENGFQIKYQGNLLDGIPRLSIFSDALDRDMWVGTSTGELHYIQFPNDKIQTFLPKNSMRTLFQLDEDRVIVATENDGWFLLNHRGGDLSKFDINHNGEPYDPYSTRNIFKIGDTLWSHSGGYIIGMHKDKREVRTYRHYPVTTMVCPNDSTLIYGTRNYHLMQFDISTRTHKSLLKTDSLFIYDLELNGDWVVGATDKGILTYNLRSKEHDLLADEYLDDSYMLMADYHAEHKFILGTRSGNLWALDPSNNNLQQLYKDDLEAGIATVIFEDDTWWINTFNGLVAFQPSTGQRMRYSEKDGLSHNEANRYSALKLPDHILMGTLKGLNYFNPQELESRDQESRLVLLKVRSYDVEKDRIGEVINRDILSSNKTIELPAEFKELQIDFGLTHNSKNGPSSFRYRFNDQDWTTIGDDQFIRFPNLAVGNYELQIEALDFSGRVIGKPLELNIRSKDFFYNTWWFYGILGLLTITILSYFLSQAREKNRMQEQFSQDLMRSQESERNRIAKDLHDSVGQQLTLIKRKAQQGIYEEISTMTNDALEEVRGISRALYPSNLKLLGLSESIEQLVYEWDESSELFFTVEIENIDEVFSEEATLNYYRFFQEALTNIMKHSKATTVGVKIEKRKGIIFTEIKDNGVGFQPSEKAINQSLGLKTLSERIRILKGDLDIQSQPGKGTRLIAEIPKP